MKARDPLKKNGRIPNQVKAEIVADRITGLSNRVIGERHGVSERSITRVINDLPQVSEFDRIPEMLADTWRDSLRTRALGVVFTSLLLIEDPKDRANVGIQILKGIGVFNPDSMQVTQMMFQTMPSEWSSEYGSCVKELVDQSKSVNPPALTDASTPHKPND